MAGEGLEKQGDIKAKDLTVEKEESRREVAMAVRGGQEEIGMARRARGRGCASTEGSMSIAPGCRYANIKQLDIHVAVFVCVVMSSHP